MFKQSIEYTDFNGNQRNEEFYFHLSLPEVTRMEAKFGRPIPEHAAELGKTMDEPALLEFLEHVILTSYGKKTSDGRSFQKSAELRSEFENSQAYAELFEMMITNNEVAQRFGEQVAETGKTKKNTVEPVVLSE